MDNETSGGSALEVRLTKVPVEAALLVQIQPCPMPHNLNVKRVTMERIIKDLAKFLRRNLQCRFGVHWVSVSDVTVWPRE